MKGGDSMKKYIDFCKSNVELVIGVIIVLIISNFVIFKMAFENHNVFTGILIFSIPYALALALVPFGISSRKKRGIGYSFIEMLANFIFIVQFFGGIIIVFKMIIEIPVIEKGGTFGVGHIFFCIFFVSGLILTLIGIVKFTYKDNGRE